MTRENARVPEGLRVDELPFREWSYRDGGTVGKLALAFLFFSLLHTSFLAPGARYGVDRSLTACLSLVPASQQRRTFRRPTRAVAAAPVVVRGLCMIRFLGGSSCFGQEIAFSFYRRMRDVVIERGAAFLMKTTDMRKQTHP